MKSVANTRALIFTLLACSMLLSGCDRIARYLPDKEKDYHYHEEIPELKLPPDLQNRADNRVSGDSQIKSSGEPERAEAALVSTAPVEVRMVTYDEGSVRIQIESSLNDAWPIVGKALTRNSIEITERNRPEAVYFVQYDPDVEKYEDESIIDEFKFFFGDDPRQELEYHIRLAEEDNLTEVLVADENDEPLAEGDGLKLLNLLYETIKADQEQKRQE